MLENVKQFFNEHWVETVFLLLAIYIAHKFAMVIISRLIRRSVRAGKHKTKAEEKQREDTLISVLNTSLRVGFWVIGALMLLGIFGVNIGPLLAGAGVVGVALGFGAQSMVKDFLSGIFILIENHYRVGDVVRINGTISGVVERVSLRETSLRDLDGVVHHIPNGFIDYASNMTMEHANVNLDVRVGYNTDLNKLEVLINKVGSELAKSEAWKNDIISPPEFLRVNDLSESAIIVKIVGTTAPMRQWAVTGELRKRLKNAFDKEGIEIPFPQRTIHQHKPLKSKNK